MPLLHCWESFPGNQTAPTAIQLLWDCLTFDSLPRHLGATELEGLAFAGVHNPESEAETLNIPDATEHIAMERDALRLLCSILIKPATRVELCHALDSGSFVEPMQRIVFEEIRSLGPVDAKRLLELLPARVTNRGFPDFDLQDLLTPKLASEEQIEQLFTNTLRLVELDEAGEGPAAQA
jgi:hypothetical protein